MLTSPRHGGVSVAHAFITLVLVASMALHASAQSAPLTPARGGTIVVSIGGDPPLLNPHFSTLPWVYMAGMNIFNSLVRLDPNLKPHPDLAASWAVTSDFKTYTFRLNRNVQWHDGRPFTSADVKFTLEEVLAKLNPNGSTMFAGFDRVDTPDPYTAIVRFVRPHPAALNYLDVPLTGVILPKHVYEGTDIRRNPANAAPIGTGPFRFVEWTRGDRIVLERNPRYFKQGLPYLDRVVFRVVRDPSARAIALQNRDVDMILGFDLPVRDSIPIRQSRDLKALFTVDRAISGQWFIGLNTSKPPFSDVKVRQAVAHAISTNLIWQRVFFGLGRIGTGPISQYLGPQYNKNVPKYPYDTQRANQLLDEAGLRRGAGGVRARVRFVYDGSTAEWARIGDILREVLADVGIEVTLESLDFNTWFDRVYVRRDYDMSSGRRVTGPDAIIAMTREYHSKAIQPAARNYYFYNNPEADRLLEQGAEEADPAKKLQIAHQVQAIIMRDLPTIILMDVPQPNAFRSTFVGLDNSPWGAQRLERVFTATR